MNNPIDKLKDMFEESNSVDRFQDSMELVVVEEGYISTYKLVKGSESITLTVRTDYGALMILTDKTEDFVKTNTNGRDNEYVYTGHLPLDNVRFAYNSSIPNKLLLGLNNSFNKITDLGYGRFSVNLGKYNLKVNDGYKLSLTK